MKKVILFLGSLIILSCSTNNEQKVIELLKTFETKDMTPWNKYVAEEYIQHNHRFANGKQPVIESILAAKNVTSRVNTLLTFSDGNYVIALNDCDIMGKMTTIDILRFENKKIVEHWDNLETYHNKKLLKVDFSNNLEVSNSSYKPIATKFIKHGNKENLHKNFKDISTSKNIFLTKKYKNLEGLFSSGQFVLLVSSGEVNGKSYSFYDLLKFKDNKILYRLNLAEPIPDKIFWKNPNGKFFN